MKRRLRFLLVMCFLILLGWSGSEAFAQFPETIEVGPHFGVTSYVGELNVWRQLPKWPKKKYNQFYYDLGGVVRYNYDTRWAFRLDYSYLKVRAKDFVTAWRPQGKLTFKTTAHDLSLLAEFNFLDYYTGRRERSFSPYIFAGISGLAYYVQPNTGIDSVDVFYLNHIKMDSLTGADSFIAGKEREGFSYALSIPFGVGVKVSLSKHLGATLEWRMHYTFTDYLDGVSGTYPDQWENQCIVATYKTDEDGNYLFSQGKPILTDYQLIMDEPETIMDELDDDQVFIYDLTDPAKTFPEGYQRGNARNNDWFGMVNLTITWKFLLPNKGACNITYH